MTSEQPLWERMPRESAKAWDAFKAYRDMGAARSLAKVAKTHGKNLTSLTRWSSQWRWVERAFAYDADCDREAAIAAKEELRRLVKRNVTLTLIAQQKLTQRFANLAPAEITVAAIPSWLRAFAAIEQIARGAPTYNVQLTGKEGGPIELTQTIIDAEQSLLRKLGAELVDNPEAQLPEDADPSGKGGA